MPEIPIRAFIVSVFVLRHVAGEAQVLLMRRTGSQAGSWCQVAGKIEAGETGWQAALRELREETGLRPETFYSADICEQFYEPYRECITLAPVFVAFVAPGAGVVLNDEHDALQWLSLDAAVDAVTFAGQRNILRHLKAEFVDRLPSPLLQLACDG